MFSRVTLKAVNAGDAEKGKGAPRLRIWGCEKVRASTTTICRYNYKSTKQHSPSKRKTTFQSYADTDRRRSMHLMFVNSPDGKRQYTLKKVVDANVSKSAHPARFSPDDKFSRYAYQ